MTSTSTMQEHNSQFPAYQDPTPEDEEPPSYLRPRTSNSARKSPNGPNGVNHDYLPSIRATHSNLPENENPNRRLSHEGPHGLGETEVQHALHSHVPPKHIWGLNIRDETIMFYCIAIPSWGMEIAASVVGTYYHSWSIPFIACETVFLALHCWALFQTMTGMMQRASWVRDEADLETRRQFLYLAVRLNRFMIPTAIIAFVTFIQAYARRYHLQDLAYWLLFLLVFIWNTVFSVMNAYNNITWESDRLQYESGDHPYRLTRLAILGIPSSKREMPKQS